MFKTVIFNIEHERTYLKLCENLLSDFLVFQYIRYEKRSLQTFRFIYIRNLYTSKRFWTFDGYWKWETITII